MEYTIIMNGRSYDLPKRTLAIAEEIEKATKIDMLDLPIREKYKVVFKVCQAIIGQKPTEEILGSSKIEELDLGEITLLFEKIVDAYQAPILEYEAEKNEDRLSRLPIAELEKITNAMASIPK